VTVLDPTESCLAIFKKGFGFELEKANLLASVNLYILNIINKNVNNLLYIKEIKLKIITYFISINNQYKAESFKTSWLAF
jgi:hypothetical protein